MHLLTTVMMAFWIWQYVKTGMHKVPDLIIHSIIVPGTSYVSWISPVQFRDVLAATGGVLLLHMVMGSKVTETGATTRKRTKSNIPPPP
jgi:hypothetical protein